MNRTSRSAPKKNTTRVRVFTAAALLLLAQFASAQTPFVPNDPFFAPGTEAGAAEGYYGQWHLVNQMPTSEVNAGIDVNIKGAWARGLTGKGVTISIVDDGLQGNHPDFVAKFQNALSWDYSKTSAENLADLYRGAPIQSDDNHGTSVGGVAAATGGNGIGMTGAAPLAPIASQRYLISGNYIGPDGNPISEGQAEAYAIGFQGQTDINGNPDPFTPYVHQPGTSAPIRVMNHSYGPREAYLADDGGLVLDALATSASYGVLHVYAAGNQSDEYPTQNTTQSLVSNSPNVIVVSALGSDGKIAAYSSYGSAVFVTAPSNSYADLYKISTTDRTGLAGYNSEGDQESGEGPDPYFTPSPPSELLDYNSTFGGTSSAAPLVAGILALGVEANPDMNIRMAKHLLALTSVRVDPWDASGTGGWVTNAAGYHFNNHYGFGNIDADAFTLAAANVLELSEARSFVGELQEVALSFGESQLSLFAEFEAAFADPLPLEEVRITLTLSGFQTDLEDYEGGIGAVIGDLSGFLISPSGTRSQFLYNDRNLSEEFLINRETSLEALEWTYLSNAFWGENLNGTWGIELVNGSTNLDYASFGTWDFFQLSAGTGYLLVVPEPSTLVILTLGGAIAFALRRKR